jgi:hypothetical protein
MIFMVFNAEIEISTTVINSVPDLASRNWLQLQAKRVRSLTAPAPAPVLVPGKMGPWHALSDRMTSKTEQLN